jgi:UDP-N-acetylglucosamine--N-acetylmuramyl-(pentapeptide) pyrophosphoryl-undecaprenol N-acetylglucosamine transferase
VRVIVSGGGTGGHVYPALAVARKIEPSSICYVGSRRGVEEEIVTREGIPFSAISAGGIRGLAPWTIAKNLLKLAKGFFQSLRIVRRFSPDVIFVTGGYVCVPVALAGRLCNVPILVYLPDIVPGLAVRFLSLLANRIAVTVEESARFFHQSKVVVTGYPVREEFFEVDKATSRRAFSLEEGLKTVAIFGGSHGARSINLAISSVLDELLEVCQVIHICGRSDFGWVMERREGLPKRLKSRYIICSYLHEGIAKALKAADLIVSRAGAATLGEFPALGVPSILVPYPYAGRHQDANADYLVERGAAVKIEDNELEERLLPTISRLLKEEHLGRMGERMRALARREAAKQIYKELELLGRIA